MQLAIPAYLLSLLRFVAGLCFLEHGNAKLLGFPAIAAYTGHLSPLVLASGYLELIGGILVCLGVLTRPAAFIVSGEMAVAYFMVHAQKSVFPAINGGDAAILYCFIFLYLAAAGGGPVTLTGLFTGRHAPLRAGLADPQTAASAIFAHRPTLGELTRPGSPPSARCRR